MHMYTITARPKFDDDAKTFNSTINAKTAAEALEIFFSKTGNIGCPVIAIARIG